jgi:stage V sporulation protein D (sporulation-specific penicillin-binding protein)
VEATFNKYLTGENGRVVRLKNGSGTEMMFNDYENLFPAENGNNITLTIDATIQHYVEKHLAQAIIDYDVQNGAACIVMDPRNAEILAMASFGNYDLNDAWGLPEQLQQAIDEITNPEERAEASKEALYAQWRNKALSDTYEPGSVFKIFTLAMALEEGLVDENSTFYCGGSVDVLGRGGDPVKCWKTAGHGTQTLAEALENSCNVAFVNIGLRVGAETFYKYVEAFGFRNRTGVDLNGEAGSIWWTDDVFEDKKNLSQLAAASFGQTFTITPIQLVTAVSAAVNGGELYTPHVVKQVTDANGNVVYEAKSEPVRQVISKETSAKIANMLELVVSEGTGKQAYVSGYRVGGKTGTTTKTVNYAQGEGKEYIVSFCGVAPTNDPQVVVLLLLDTPSQKSGIYVSGGNMAAPVGGKILADILPYLGIPPEYSDDEKQDISITVPRVTGKDTTAVVSELKALGLETKVIGDGDTITDQLPAANATVASGTRVILYAGTAKPENSTVKMPDLAGRTYENAKAVLEENGLFIRTSGARSSISSARVSIQSAAVGEMLPYGTVVEVVLVDQSIQGRY